MRRWSPPISYSYLVTNNGNVTLHDVRVSDPHDGLSPLGCDPAQPASLDPGQTMTCTASYTTTQADLDAGSITNVGTVTGTPPTGPAVTDTDDAVVTADQLQLSGHQQRQRDPARRAGE